MNYYNDNDPTVCEWIRELIEEGLVPDGEVDCRSIEEVQPEDLRGFDQCHFFAGILGWPYALQLAGIPDDYELWTASCPCQPLSVAGKRRGEKDSRHLWPAFCRLIRECKPAIVFGEQVDSKDGLEWLAGISLDLEDGGYAVALASLNAAGVNAPHIRQRLYWMAVSSRIGRGGGSDGNASERSGQVQTEGRIALGNGRLGNSDRKQTDAPVARQSVSCERRLLGDGVAVTDNARSQGRQGAILQECARQWAVGEGSTWHLCKDGKHRRIPKEPQTQSSILGVVDGLSGGVEPRGEESLFPLAEAQEARVMMLRGYGNAIVPQLAALFIETAFEAIAETMRK